MTHARSRVALCLSVVLAIAFFASSSSAGRQDKSAEPRPAAGPKASELSVVAANVQMLLIAPDGKRTGYDPKTKKELRAIPGSAYYQDALLAYDSGRVDPNTTQTIDVHHPVAGRYSLVVSSGSVADGEEYEIRVNLYFQDGGDARTTRITGTAKKDHLATYEFRVSENPAAAVVSVEDHSSQTAAAR